MSCAKSGIILTSSQRRQIDGSVQHTIHTKQFNITEHFFKIASVRLNEVKLAK